MGGKRSRDVRNSTPGYSFSAYDIMAKVVSSQFTTRKLSFAVRPEDETPCRVASIRP